MRIPLIFLLGISTAFADLTVSSGFLVIADGHCVETSTVKVKSGATLKMQQNGTLKAALLEILSSGTVQGCGTLLCPIQNSGNIIADCGSTNWLKFGSTVTNNGNVRASNGTKIIAEDASFINNGVLDLIFGDPTLPTLLSGSGRLVTPESHTFPPIQLQFETDGSVTLIYDALSGHIYQVQWSPDLAPENWFDLSTDSQPLENSATRQVNDPGASAGTATFYRYQILE